MMTLPLNDMIRRARAATFVLTALIGIIGINLVVVPTALAQKKKAAKPAPASPEAAYQQAREAYRLKDGAALADLAPAFAEHPLGYYAEYWQLLLDKAQAKNEGMEVAYQAFIAKHEGAYLADRTRMELLKAYGKTAAKSGDWSTFDAQFPKLGWDDPDTTCYDILSRSVKTDSPAKTTALEEGRWMWLSPKDLPEGCVALSEGLFREKRLFVPQVWERVKILVDANLPGAARRALQYLPDAQVPSEKDWALATESPARWFAKISGGEWDSKSRTQRELTLVAIAKTARDNPRQAAEFWRANAKEPFTAAEQQSGWALIATHAARRHFAEAAQWGALAGDAQVSDEMHQWIARGGLRALDWKVVQRAIARMSPESRKEATWVYWQARALKAQGKADEATALFTSIAGEYNFYGQLAGEEIGRLTTLPPKGYTPTADEIATMRDKPGLQRALALYRMANRVDANREWNWTLKGMTDQQLITAAEVARQAQILDRAVNTSDRTKETHDFSQRFLHPFRDKLKPQAESVGLDEAWVYGLIRQESRFIMDAKSSAGASGLMQLMPATARWVAGKIGIAGYNHAQVNDIDTNLALGTNYLKMVLDDLGHPALASAGYNAGPGRPRRWRDVKPMEGAIYAESIPLNETRDYVKKVMSNATFYAALFTGKPQSLKTRMGTMSARKAEEKGAELP